MVDWQGRLAAAGALAVIAGAAQAQAQTGAVPEAGREISQIIVLSGPVAGLLGVAVIAALAVLWRLRRRRGFGAVARVMAWVARGGLCLALASLLLLAIGGPRAVPGDPGAVILLGLTLGGAALGYWFFWIAPLRRLAGRRDAQSAVRRYMLRRTAIVYGCGLALAVLVGIFGNIAPPLTIAAGGGGLATMYSSVSPVIIATAVVYALIWIGGYRRAPGRDDEPSNQQDGGQGGETAM